jgi:hypothetical protein
MKKLVAVAALLGGFVLATIPMTAVVAQQSMPCYHGQAYGPCPK